MYGDEVINGIYLHKSIVFWAISANQRAQRARNEFSFLVTITDSIEKMGPTLCDIMLLFLTRSEALVVAILAASIANSPIYGNKNKHRG